MATRASATPAANTVVKALATGKIAAGWLDLTTLFTGILDTQFSVVDAADTTKKFAVGVNAGMTTAKTLTLDTGAQTNDRTASVPVLAGNDTFAMLAIANPFTAAQTITAANGLTTQPAATQDALRIAGRAGGTNSYVGTLTVAALSASRTYTMPDADLTFTGGGTIALGGFTLTVPATGTAALLAAANAFTNSNTITTAGGPTAILALSSSSGNANFSVNAPTGQLSQWKWNINNATLYTAIASAASWSLFDTPNAFTPLVYTANSSSAATFTIAMTTPSSSTTTGALIVSGGVGVAGSIYAGSIIQAGNASTAGTIIIKAANASQAEMQFYNVSGNGYAFFRTASDTDLSFYQNGTFNNTVLSLKALGNVVVGAAARATNATDGFLYIPTCAGTPTGTPTAYTGRAPLIIDSTNNKLYFYSSGAWRDAGP